ncbi:hypothetical protein BgiBS90_030163 [Biomphalaria glabrata]|nr:hypothetical protein BgiBS90_030163 [Biomphalaria glabrata]
MLLTFYITVSTIFFLLHACTSLYHSTESILDFLEQASPIDYNNPILPSTTTIPFSHRLQLSNSTIHYNYPILPSTTTIQFSHRLQLFNSPIDYNYSILPSTTTIQFSHRLQLFNSPIDYNYSILPSTTTIQFSHRLQLSNSTIHYNYPILPSTTTIQFSHRLQLSKSPIDYNYPILPSTTTIQFSHRLQLSNSTIDYNYPNLPSTTTIQFYHPLQLSKSPIPRVIVVSFYYYLLLPSYVIRLMACISVSRSRLLLSQPLSSLRPVSILEFNRYSAVRQHRGALRNLFFCLLSQNMNTQDRRQMSGFVLRYFKYKAVENVRYRRIKYTSIDNLNSRRQNTLDTLYSSVSQTFTSDVTHRAKKSVYTPLLGSNGFHREFCEF